MPDITLVTPKDLPDLLKMIGKLCAFHGDACQMGLADAQAQFIVGPLIAFIARNDEQAAGYCVLEPHWRPMETGPMLDIAHLFVEEPLRGRGIGKALIGAAVACAGAQGASRLTIGTSPDNPGAAAAYKRMGHTEITTTPGARFDIAFEAKR